MTLNDVFFRRSEPRWMNQEPPPYGYGGNSPRTELRVIMCCLKCEEKAREEIEEVDGVQEVFTDQARSEVVVYGYADSHDVLKKARKVDKRAEVMSSDSFTLHHSKHHHKHNRIHHKHDKHDKHYKYDKHNRGHFANYSHGHGHSYNGRSNHLPIESVGSPRYNSSFNQSSYRHAGSSTYGLPDYRQSYNQHRPRELEYRHMHDGYRSEPEFNRYQYNDMYRPQSEYRSMYDDYRPEHEHRHRYNGYRPSQSYPPSYVDDRDYRDSPYPEVIMNPDYMKPMDYYY